MELWEILKTNYFDLEVKTKPSVYPSPRDLFEKGCEYFQYVDENPISEPVSTFYEGELVDRDRKRKRVYTVTGLRLWLGLACRPFNEYTRRPGFAEVMEFFKDIIYTQKFEGAAVGVFNANLISRSLGLSEKVDVDNKTEITEIKRTVIDPSKGVQDRSDAGDIDEPGITGEDTDMAAKPGVSGDTMDNGYTPTDGGDRPV